MSPILPKLIPSQQTLPLEDQVIQSFGNLSNQVESLQKEAENSGKKLLLLAVKPTGEETSQSVIVNYLLQLVSNHLGLENVLLKDKSDFNTTPSTKIISLVEKALPKIIGEAPKVFKTNLSEKDFTQELHDVISGKMPKMISKSLNMIIGQGATEVDQPMLDKIYEKSFKILNGLLGTQKFNIGNNVVNFFKKYLSFGDDVDMSPVTELFEKKIEKYAPQVLENQYLNATQDARNFIADKETSQIVFCDLPHIKSIMVDSKLKEKYDIRVLPTDNTISTSTKLPKSIAEKTFEIFMDDCVPLLEKSLETGLFVNAPYAYFGIKGTILALKMAVKAWKWYEGTEDARVAAKEVNTFLDKNNEEISKAVVMGDVHHQDAIPETM